MLAYASGDFIELWDSGSRQVKGQIKFGEPATALTWSPDGTRLAIAGTKQAIQIFDAASASPIVERRGHHALVTSSLPSPDGSEIITGDNWGSMIRWELPTGRILARRSPMATSDIGKVLQYSPDGREISVLTQRGELQFYNSKTFALLRAVTVGQARYGKALSMSGRWFAYRPYGPSNNVIQLVDTQNPANSRPFEAPELTVETRLSFSPDEHTLAIACRGVVLFWQLGDNQVSRIPNEQAQTTGGELAWSPDGRFVCVNDNRGLNLLEVSARRRVWRVEGIRGTPQYSPDGVLILAVQPVGATVIDAGTGMTVTTIDAHDDWMTDGRFVGDGRRLVTCGYDRVAWVWDLGKLLRNSEMRPLSPTQLRTELSQRDPVRGYRAGFELLDRGDELVTLARATLAGREGTSDPVFPFWAKPRVIQLLEWHGSDAARALLATLSDTQATGALVRLDARRAATQPTTQP